jgi:AraC-like DNA-binding protein
MTEMLDLSLRSYGAQPLSHSHGFHQIVLPLAGALEMEVGTRGGRVEGCQAAIVPAGTNHACQALGPNHFLVLDWLDDGDDGLARLSDAGARRPFLTCDPGLQHLVRFLGFELAQQRAPRPWGGLLLQALGARLTDDAVVYPAAVSRALAYIDTNFAEPLDVATIGRAAHSSASHLHALFKRHLGRSPMAVVAEARLDHALALLATTDEPVSRIALAAGYADQSALTRALRRQRGTTPAAYRRRCRGMAPRAPGCGTRLG